MDIFERAESRTKEAWRIIGNLDLIDRWSQLGEPVIVGSVCLGLVVTYDIDLDVYASTLSVADSFQIMAELAQVDNVVGVTLKNEKGNRDKWLYWQILYETSDAVRWNIEIYYKCL